MDGTSGGASGSRGGIRRGLARIARLARTDLAHTTDEALVEVITASARVVAQVEALGLAATAELCRRRPAPGGPVGERDRGVPGHTQISEFAVDEVATALHLTHATAGARVTLALDLDERLHGTAVALAAGDLDLPRARVLAEGTRVLDRPDQLERVEEAVLPDAPEQTTGQLRAAVARAVIDVDTSAAQARHERARLERRVQLFPQPDGMATLSASLPAPEARAVYAGIDLLARAWASREDQRSGDQRRADALVHLVTSHPAINGTDTGDDTSNRTGLGGFGRARALVNVTVSATTLLGLDDRPASLAGYGPIPAHLARTIASDATWRRILTDPMNGIVCEVGGANYRPGAVLDRHATTTWQTCTFPGCRQPAQGCDLDHRTPWPTGPTDAANLAPLCRRHHRLKHETRWSVTDRANELTWTSPTGHTYRVRLGPPLSIGPPPTGPPGLETDRR